MPVVGQVVELWRYPFKSMQGERLNTADVGVNGFWGDRGWSLRDLKNGKNVSAKQVSSLMLCATQYAQQPTEAQNPPVEIRLPDGARRCSDDPKTTAALAQLTGLEVTLDAAPGAHFDDFAIHLLTTASLETLTRLNPAADFDIRRFRPNILIKPSGETQEGFVELGWCGQDLRVGEAEFLVKKPTSRCVMTTHAQEGLPKDPSVLKTIAQAADAHLGVYASVLKPGRIALGDSVVLL